MTENKDIQRLTWKFEDFNLSKVQFCIIKMLDKTRNMRYICIFE